MRFTFDNFVAAMTCSKCGAISPADDSTFMQTHIRDEPKMDFLGVGDELKVDPGDIGNRGYLTVRPPGVGEAVRILQTWRCPSCQTWPKWAEVLIAKDRIQSITPVALGLASLDRAHYIEDDARDVVAALTGRAYADIAPDEVLPLLRGSFQREGSRDCTSDGE